jgi:hypothetical protein
LADLAVILRGKYKFSNNAVLSQDDVYGSNKIMIDLPIGSFSKNNGVFIPIPSYIDEKMELVASHWVYVKGMWNGRTWSDNWFPSVPSFIKTNGKRNKIYYENGGYWIYNSNNNGKINLF